MYISLDKSCLISVCQWGEWGDFTSCTKTCGEGRKSRYRAVFQEAMHGGDACLGNSTDMETCNVGDCPGILSLIASALI